MRRKGANRIQHTHPHTHTHTWASASASPEMSSQPRIVPASLDFFFHHRLPCNLTWACATDCCGCDTQLNLNGSGTASSFLLWSGGFQGTLFGANIGRPRESEAGRAVLARVESSAHLRRNCIECACLHCRTRNIPFPLSSVRAVVLATEN